MVDSKQSDVLEKEFDGLGLEELGNAIEKMVETMKLSGGL